MLPNTPAMRRENRASSVDAFISGLLLGGGGGFLIFILAVSAMGLGIGFALPVILGVPSLVAGVGLMVGLGTHGAARGFALGVAAGALVDLLLLLMMFEPALRTIG